MAKQLTIFQIEVENTPEIGVLEPGGGDVVIGRAPDSDNPEDKQRTIRVSSYVVSRRHGTFSEVKEHWLFKDNNSTNGSWLNGVPVRPQQWRIARPGNVIAMADITIELRSSGDQEAESYGEAGADQQRSLLAFENGVFQSEYRVATAGQVLSLGGEGSDLKIEEYPEESPPISIELDGMNLRVVRGAPELPVQVNGAELGDSLELFDGDTLQVGSFAVLFNDPVSAPRKPEIRPIREDAGDDRPAEGVNKSPQSNLFGKVDFGDEKIRRKTQLINPAEFRRQFAPAPDVQTHYKEEAIPEDVQPRRFIPRSTWEALDLNAMEDLVVMVFAGILIFGLLLAGLYFLLR